MANEQICLNGHVTDPDVDIDTRNGQPLVSSAASDRWDGAMVERGGEAWRRICRAEVRMGAVRSPHQCRAKVEPLSDHPELEAAFRLGGAAAVAVIIRERGGHRPKA